MTIPAAFILGFFMGAICAFGISFLMLVIYFYGLITKDTEQIYGDNQENTESETT